MEDGLENYRRLLKIYDDMDEIELKQKIKIEIIDDYKYKKLSKKWR